MPDREREQKVKEDTHKHLEDGFCSGGNRRNLLWDANCPKCKKDMRKSLGSYFNSFSFWRN